MPLPVTPLTRLGHAVLAAALLAAAAIAGTFGGPLVWAGLVAPDLTLVGAFAGGGRLRPERVAGYNAVHAWWGPLAAAALAVAVPALVPLALGWALHVCVDRALGFGLRDADGDQRRLGSAACPA